MYSPTAKIFVIDALMGCGKTTWAINYINDNPDKSFIFVTPFLSEIRRIKDSCADFTDPQHINGRKIEGFNFLLESGRNIVVTHSTFANSNAETMRLIRENKYILILDEVLDILVGFNEVAQNKIKPHDIDILLDKKMIEVDQYGKVTWTAKAYDNSSYSDVQRLATNGNLLLLNGTLLVWQFPPQIFELFTEVFVLTFLFDGSFMKPYFQYHNIEYSLMSMSDGLITPYAPVTKETKEMIKSLLQIDNDHARNDYKQSSLSKSWSKNASSNTKTKLKNHITNYINNVIKCKSNVIMWTTYNSDDCNMRKALKGKGYTRRTISVEDEQTILADAALNNQEKNTRLENAKSCFVPCNARASNEYRDRNVCVYAVNLYPNPYVTNYFQQKNDADNTDIHVDIDKFALSCMLQWLWRSQIRDGKPIHVYIPSTRMRNLLIGWLNE